VKCDIKFCCAGTCDGYSESFVRSRLWGSPKDSKPSSRSCLVKKYWRGEWINGTNLVITVFYWISVIFLHFVTACLFLWCIAFWILIKKQTVDLFLYSVEEYWRQWAGVNVKVAPCVSLVVDYERIRLLGDCVWSTSTLRLSFSTLTLSVGWWRSIEVLMYPLLVLQWMPKWIDRSNRS